MKYDNWGEGLRDNWEVRPDAAYDLSGAFDASFGDRQGQGYTDARLPIEQIEGARGMGGLKTNTRMVPRGTWRENAREWGATTIRRNAQLDKWRRFGLNRSSAGSLYR
jgi:hypothetical protein